MGWGRVNKEMNSLFTFIFIFLVIYFNRVIGLNSKVIILPF